MRIKKGKNNLFKNKNEFKININDLAKLNFIEKNEKIRDLIKEATGIRNNIKSKDLLKIIDYIDDNKNEIMVINKELLIRRDNDELIISYRKGKMYTNVIFFVVAVILITVIATYSYLLKERLLTVNKDINNDGIPELNIDKNKDGVADINIDINYDNKPDYNMNYLNNGEAIFNIKDGNKYKNPINQDIDNDSKCDINCDINDDGWPDINLDINGDGYADLFIDSENKGYATLNIDINGDKVCDINCDTDDNNKCDKNCLDFEVIKYIDIKNGNVGVDINTVVPSIELEGNVIDCSSLYPNDQPQNDVLKECKATFKVKNTSSINASYNLKIVIDNNTFTSENLKYKILSDNGENNIPNYVTVPKISKTIIKSIKINPKSTHTYDVSFIIEGQNETQNYDAGKNLKVKFIIET